MTLYRPEPILRHDAVRVDRSRPPWRAAERLLDGETLIVTDHYGTGAEILDQLQSILRPPPQQASYRVRQGHRRTLRQASLRLLAPIVEHRLALTDARHIGFLRELYPELSRTFFLPFVQVQELHGAWVRYEEGVNLAVLGHRVHPFYGTYVPTRVSHLELFGTWISQYQGPRTRAIDVGTGCGVLALMLGRAGFERVLATDDNPNAIESLRRELRRLPSPPSIDPVVTDLLGEDDTLVDLVVFNPPWIQGAPEGLLDRALNFEDGLFERFFDQASERLSPSGRIVLVFSNVIQLLQPEHPHPILTELEAGRFQLVQKLQRKVKSQTRSGQRRRTRERVEIWELARA
ncbi:MAG TPA: methyltransferase [Myxococcota bacterium]|nr:methyltransferase [Myxococcota bacterium]